MPLMQPARVRKPTVVKADPPVEVAQYFTNWKLMTCPSCFDEYTLGKNGTINGCDRCEGITRDRNGMIIEDPFKEVFIVKQEDGDTAS